MLRFLPGFIYVLCTLLNSSASSSVRASFNDSCSNTSSCIAPLICSTAKHCICPKTFLFWNAEHNDCFYCPPGWIIWKNNRCVSFAVPSESGVSYAQANDTCQSFSAQLYRIEKVDELRQLELELRPLLNTTFSSAVTLFFRLGAWIDGSNGTDFENRWCDGSDSNAECVAVKEKTMKNASLCLSRLNCHAEMLFICDSECNTRMAAVPEKYLSDSISSNHRLAPIIATLAPMALELVGNLFGGNRQPQQPSDPQQVIIHQGSGTSQASAPESSDNTAVYVVLAIGAVVLLLIICGICLAILGCVGYLKTSSSGGATNNRSSITSALSVG